MTQEWVMVRLRKRTAERLRSRLTRLEQQYVRGNVYLQRDLPLTIDALVVRLLNHVDNDDRRKRESRMRRAKARRMPRKFVAALQEIEQ